MNYQNRPNPRFLHRTSWHPSGEFQPQEVLFYIRGLGLSKLDLRAYVCNKSISTDQALAQSNRRKHMPYNIYP